MGPDWNAALWTVGTVSAMVGSLYLIAPAERAIARVWKFLRK